MNVFVKIKNKRNIYILLIFLIVSLIFALYFLHNNQANVNFLINSTMEASDTSVKVFVQIEGQGKQAHVRLENTSAYDLYSFGYTFALFIYDGGHWKKVPFKEPPVFLLIALHLHPHSYYEWTIDLYRIFGELTAGEYRFVTHVSRKDSEDREWSSNIEVAVRFTL